MKMNIYTYLVDLETYRKSYNNRQQIEVKACDKLEAVCKAIDLCNPIVKLWGVDRIK